MYNDIPVNITGAPYDTNQINYVLGQFSPSTVNIDSKAFRFWLRALYQRASSVFKWTVPKTWNGPVFDFFIRCLFQIGYVGVFDTEKYGYSFQPVGLKGMNFYYQPSGFIVNNPELQKEFTCGKDGELLKMTPDWTGVFDVIQLYAERMALMDASINMSIINTKQPHIYAARNKAGREALKKMEDVIQMGNPLVVLDAVLYMNEELKTDAIFDLSPKDLKSNYITDQLLASYEQIIKEFDQEMGIPTISEKKERMVTSEAETKVVDGTCRSKVWLECLQNSIKNIKEIFPDIELDVELRYDTDKEEVEENVTVQDDTERD